MVQPLSRQPGIPARSPHQDTAFKNLMSSRVTSSGDVDPSSSSSSSSSGCRGSVVVRGSLRRMVGNSGYAHMYHSTGGSPLSSLTQDAGDPASLSAENERRALTDRDLDVIEMQSTLS